MLGRLDIIDVSVSAVVAVSISVRKLLVDDDVNWNPLMSDLVTLLLVGRARDVDPTAAVILAAAASSTGLDEGGVLSELLDPPNDSPEAMKYATPVAIEDEDDDDDSGSEVFENEVAEAWVKLNWLDEDESCTIASAAVSTSTGFLSLDGATVTVPTIANLL